MKKKESLWLPKEKQETEAEALLKKQNARKKKLQQMRDESQNADTNHVKFLNKMINETDDKDEMERLLKRRDRFLKEKIDY